MEKTETKLRELDKKIKNSSSIIQTVIQNMEALNLDQKEITFKYPSATFTFITRGFLVENIIQDKKPIPLDAVLDLLSSDEINENEIDPLKKIVRSNRTYSEMMKDISFLSEETQKFVKDFFYSQALENLVEAELLYTNKILPESTKMYENSFSVLKKTPKDIELLRDNYLNAFESIEKELGIRNADYSFVSLIPTQTFFSFKPQKIIEKFIFSQAHTAITLDSLRFYNKGFAFIDVLKEVEALVTKGYIEVRVSGKSSDSGAFIIHDENKNETLRSLTSDESEVEGDLEALLNENNELEATLIHIMREINETKDRYTRDIEFFEKINSGEVNSTEKEKEVISRNVQMLHDQLWESEKKRYEINSRRVSLLSSAVKQSDPDSVRILERKIIAIKSITDSVYDPELEKSEEIIEEPQFEEIETQDDLEENIPTGINSTETVEEAFQAIEKPQRQLVNVLNPVGFFDPIKINGISVNVSGYLKQNLPDIEKVRRIETVEEEIIQENIIPRKPEPFINNTYESIAKKYGIEL